MKKHPVIPFVVLVVFLTAALAGCGAPATAPIEEPAPVEQEPTEAPAVATAGGTLVIAMNLDDVVTLDPAYAGETTNLFIHINTYDTLVDIRPDDLNTIVPRLAESWEVNDDFTEFIFHLRKAAWPFS